MKKTALFLLALTITLLTLSGCSDSLEQQNYEERYGPSTPKERQPTWEQFQGQGFQNKVSFNKDVKPILDKRCVVCHSCYDAPCQLKLNSFEGIERGATKKVVYNGARLSNADPTRLFIDAQTTEQWRDMGFYPVLNEGKDNVNAELLNSPLYRVLQQKFLHPLEEDTPLPESLDISINRKQQCATINEFDDFERRYPLAGMPYGTPELTDDEFITVARWLSAGALQDPKPKVDPFDTQVVKEWEAFLNQTDNKERLMARYIYEHLFLAHIHFSVHGDRRFYRLIRSTTPPGEKIQEISTLRPYDDPGSDPFYYRFRPITATIVDKTHLVYALNEARMARYKTLFLEPKYRVDSLPDYSPENASNPFKTFAAIPSQSRYEFLLDEARFFISGFIKGPVCRGQIALNVIDDQFWAVFTDPKTDLLSQDTDFIRSQADNLKLPAATSDSLRPSNIWFSYGSAQDRYLRAKNRYVLSSRSRDQGAQLADIWQGNGENKNAALSIFRHFDSATVEHGFIGYFPKTGWLLDYPLFERIHYLLVAGFDVYGNVGHQLSTRLYMDYLRLEAEQNFLSLLPSKDRLRVRDSWYQGNEGHMARYWTRSINGISWETRLPFDNEHEPSEREVFRILQDYLGENIAATDPLNQCDREKCTIEGIDDALHPIAEELQHLAKVRGRALGKLPELSLVKIIPAAGEPFVVSMILNRAHLNNASLFMEDDRRQPDKDTLTVYPGFIGSYPNFYYEVAEQQLASFVSLVASTEPEAKTQLNKKFGIRRTRHDFWFYNDWFNNQHLKLQPLRAGLLDLNRYEDPR